MKKFFLTLLIYVLTCGSAFAFDILSYPPPITGGNVLVDAGIGLTAYGSSYGNISIPPIFVNVEYALPVELPISVGGFAAFYRYNYRVIGNSGWQYTFLTFGGRADWHWGFDISWLDLYSGIWIGYNVFSADWVGSDSGNTTPTTPTHPGLPYGSLLPKFQIVSSSGYTAPSYGGFCYGFQFGAHFYFTNNIGLVLESGYPFALKVGAALKFGGNKGNQSTAISTTQQRNSSPANNARPGGDSSEQMILRVAKENKGILTISDLVLGAGIPMDEAKKNLDDFVEKGYAELRTRSNGSQVYIIPDFLEEPLEGF